MDMQRKRGRQRREMKNKLVVKVVSSAGFLKGKRKLSRFFMLRETETDTRTDVQVYRQRGEGEKRLRKKKSLSSVKVQQDI